MNIAYYLRRAAACFPDQVALAVGTQSVRTYKEFADRAALIGTYLRSKYGSATRPTTIAIFAENSPEYLELLFAIWSAGFTAVPINAKLHPSEVGYILRDCGATACFVDNTLPPISFADCSCQHPLNKMCLDYMVAKGAKVVPHIGDVCLSTWVAWIFYTSGTTGKPKGALLTHDNLDAMCKAFLIDVKPVQRGDAMIHSCQLSHGSGLYALPHIVKAGVNVMLPHKFDEYEANSLLQQWHGCTFGPPTVLNRIVKARIEACCDEETFGTLIFGGSPLYAEDAFRAHDVFKGRIVQIYGQGESPCTITSITEDMYAADFKRCSNSVGVAQCGVDVRIKPNKADPLGPGEVQVRGATVMRGYLNNPEATAAALEEGWLNTGDIGTMDRDGFLTLMDRSKDVIISGGFNCYPREIEEVLLKHELVKEVSVIGRPDKEWGEVIVAAVVLDLSCIEMRALPEESDVISELDALCLASIARFKRPRDYIFMAQLPKGLTGKVQKSELRRLINEK